MEEVKELENSDRRLMSMFLITVKWHLSENPERRMYFYSMPKEGIASDRLSVRYKHELKSLHYTQDKLSTESS